MTAYVLLKNLHIFLALISMIGFGLRGYLKLVLGRPLIGPLVRIGPHVIDTLLLLSGIALWVQMRFSVWSWFGLKLLLVLAYIVIGIAAFRKGRSGTGIMLYLLALFVFLGVAWIAIYKPMI